MAGKRQQIHVERIHVDGNFSGGLHRVRVEINFVLLGDAADFFERLHGTEFIVGVHHGDQCRLRRHPFQRPIGISPPALDCFPHSIRINDQWRICFVWTAGGPNDVEIVDYYR